MSVDESQWTHGFDVNWCDYFIMNFTTAVFYSLFSTLDIAFAEPIDEFFPFINSLLIGENTCILIC